MPGVLDQITSPGLDGHTLAMAPEVEACPELAWLGSVLKDSEIKSPKPAKSVFPYSPISSHDLSLAEQPIGRSQSPSSSIPVNKSLPTLLAEATTSVWHRSSLSPCQGPPIATLRPATSQTPCRAVVAEAWSWHLVWSGVYAECYLRRVWCK